MYCHLQHPGRTPCGSGGSWGPPRFPSPGPHGQVVLCAVSCVGVQTPSPSTWLHRGGESPTGMEQHQRVLLQSKPSPCASSPYFITEASYIWRFRSLGGTQTLTATTPGLREHLRAPQPSGCSGHPSCKHKLYRPSPRSWAGTATLRQTPCAAAWRGHKEAAVPGTSSAFCLRKGHPAPVPSSNA